MNEIMKLVSKKFSKNDFNITEVAIAKWLGETYEFEYLKGIVDGLVIRKEIKFPMHYVKTIMLNDKENKELARMMDDLANDKSTWSIDGH